MKIDALSPYKGFLKAYNTNVINEKKHNKYEQQNELTSFDSNLLNNYFVSFTAKKQLPQMQSQQYEDYQQFDNNGVRVENSAVAIAKSQGHAEANHLHVMHSAFDETLQFIKDLKDEKTDLFSMDAYSAPAFFSDIFSKKLFEEPKLRDKFAEVLKEENKIVENLYDTVPKSKKGNKTIDLSDGLWNDIEAVRESLFREESLVNSFDVYNGAFLSDDGIIKPLNNTFRQKVNDVLMLEDPKADKGFHFSSYDSKAENVMKNLNLNTNVFVTYDREKVNPNSFVPSFINAFEKSEGKFNPKNTVLIECNDQINMAHIIEKAHKLSKDKDKNYILLYSQLNMATNSQTKDSDTGMSYFYMSKDYIDLIAKPPKNVKFVVVETKDNYLKYLQGKQMSDMITNSAEISLPVLNSQEVFSAMKHQPKLLKEIAPGITTKALEKVVNVSTQLAGTYPDKAVNLLKQVAMQYPDKKEITTTDVDKYFKDAEYLFKSSNNDSSVEMVFDTGKRLKDVVGKTNTKKEAEYIVKQIKNKKIGTKGFIIYSQDGMVGGGRRHTAEAIAGEAKVPFVSINTMDFATKDVDLFGGSSMTPEASIKKLFSLVSTQAESNPCKSAVLFIENFEYFSVGEMISEYHQKAMAQLIREMDNAEKKGLNIVVMGSVSNPQYIGEATMKSFKFNDNIEVSSPAFDEDDRYEVLKHAFKENKIKMAGSKDEQEKLLKDMAKTLRGFSFIDLKGFTKKAESIAQERGHSKVEKADLTESYLRITTGRPSNGKINQHEKELTTKHECGHAVTLQIMNDLMKKKGQPWMVSDTVNFITLDPRGYYGGAMYHKADDNREGSFEKYFSNIVCSYGGHSAENKFYGMNGSWGITGDLHQVTSMAETMITAMGQGYYTGKISLVNMYGEEDFSRNITNNMKDKIDADVQVITRNALTASNLIVDTYADFINEFSERYADKVGTGECLIDGDQFRKELTEWKERQPIAKQAEFDVLEEMILNVIECAKNGKLY